MITFPQSAKIGIPWSANIELAYLGAPEVSVNDWLSKYKGYYNITEEGQTVVAFEDEIDATFFRLVVGI